VKKRTRISIALGATSLLLMLLFATPKNYLVGAVNSSRSINRVVVLPVWKHPYPPEPYVYVYAGLEPSVLAGEVAAAAALGLLLYGIGGKH